MQAHAYRHVNRRWHDVEQPRNQALRILVALFRL